MTHTLCICILFAAGISLAAAVRYPLAINDTVTAVVATNSSLLVFVATTRIYVFNTSSQSWINTSWWLSPARDYTTVNVAHSRYIVVIGGYGPLPFAPAIPVIEAFDTWDFLRPGITGSISEPLLSASTFVDETTGAVLMVGGRTLNNSLVNWVTRIYVENDSNIIMSLAASSLPQARYAHESAHAPGFMAVIGGLTPSATGPPQLSGTVAVSTNSGNSWYTLAESLSPGRYQPCAVVVLGRYLVIAGGVIYAPYNTTNELDVFDIITQQRAVMPATLHLRERRAWCAAAALGPYVYIAGGTDASLLGSRTTSSVEVLDVRDWTLFYVANLSGTRQETASMETTNAVYFVNGVDSPTIDYYQCGNGRIDAGEVCDIGESDCLKNCTGRRVNATAPAPSTRSAAFSKLHGICALMLIARTLLV